MRPEPTALGSKGGEVGQVIHKLLVEYLQEPSYASRTRRL